MEDVLEIDIRVSSENGAVFVTAHSDPQFFMTKITVTHNDEGTSFAILDKQQLSALMKALKVAWEVKYGG